MSSIIQSIFTRLSGVSPQLAPSIYPVALLPLKHDLPAIIFELNDDVDEQLLDGARSSMSTAIFTVECLSDTLLGALAVAARVKAALDGYTGTMGDHAIVKCFKETEGEAPERSMGVQGIALQFFIAYE